MTKEFLMSLGLDEEIAEKVFVESENELKNYITSEQHLTELNNLKKENAVDIAILKAKGKDTKIVKAALDMDNINFKSDGTLEGLDLKKVEKEYPYLFESETVITRGTGAPKGGNTPNYNEMYELNKAMGINY